MKRLDLLSRDRLYSIVLIYLFVFFVTVLVASESISYFDTNFFPNLFRLFVAILWALFFIYILEILRTFGHSQRSIRIVRIALILGMIIGFLVGNPMLEYYKTDFALYLFIGFHVMTLVILVFVLSAILSDIFTSGAIHQDHIWGAVVSYFLAILIFADFYEIISLINPGYLGEVYERGLPNYIECILFSINSMTGLDSLYPDASGLFKKFSNLENLTGNLFLIVVLGRLLSSPLGKKD